MTFGLGFELRCCLDRQKNRRFYLIVEMTRRSVLIVQGLKLDYSSLNSYTM